MLNKKFSKYFDDLYNTVGNIDGMQVDKEGVDTNAKTTKPSEGSLGESSDPPMLPKSPEPYRSPFPFAHNLKENKQDKQFLDLFNMLSKVNINLPLLVVIRNVPSYTKFFKDLSTKKRICELNERVIVLEISNVVLQLDLPHSPKLKDLRIFVINITIEDKKVAKSMLDLGTSTNLIPY